MNLLHIQPNTGKLVCAIRAFKEQNPMYVVSTDYNKGITTCTWGTNSVTFTTINSREDYERKIKGSKYCCLYIHKKCKIDPILLQDIQFGMRKQ